MPCLIVRIFRDNGPQLDIEGVGILLETTDPTDVLASLNARGDYGSTYRSLELEPSYNMVELQEMARHQLSLP